MNLEIYAPSKRLKVEKPDTIRKLNKVESFIGLSPRTSHDVSKLMGMTVSGAGLYLNTLYYEKRIHIVDWEGTGSHLLPVFGIGDGVDKARPKSCAITKKIRDRKRRELELTQQEQDLINLRNWIPHRDPLVAAFFGRR